jgi:oligopeptide/dipeptide ABC transporter ATP-binding protein
MGSLLSVRDLSVNIGRLEVIDGISFDLRKGEVLGVVGESGSGKSITAMSVIGLLALSGGRVAGGSISFDGIELTRLPESDYRALRGKRIALIMQNPMTSLDPVLTVGRQIDQVSRLHLGLSAAAARARSIDLMQQLRIPEAAAVYHQYPHQLSGGMKQRIVIAMALAADPDLIIADEPTTALDVTIQAQIVQILVDLVRDRDLALMLITHDMGVVAQTCDSVVVLYAGRVAESNTVERVFAAPQHPYTRALIACIPRRGMRAGDLQGIAGAVPSVADYPAGCRFNPRCPLARSVCRSSVPALAAAEGGGLVACHFGGEAEEAVRHG